MAKVVKLIMVTDINNNKYYNMFEQADGTFKVEYGRVDSTVQHASYSMRDWDKKYREKTNKGYKDITHLYEEVDTTSAATVDETFISNDKFVKQLIEDLQRYANNTVKENYKVSTKNVTQKMIDEAQTIIDEIAKVYNSKYTKDDLNELLLKLFTIIPRKMGHVQDYLVNDGDSKERVAKIIDNEQSILDTLAGQVLIQEPVKEDKNNDKKVGILDQMGISVSHVEDPKVIAMVKKLMGDSSNKFSRLFEVTNFETEKRYKKNKIENEELLWHGSRNENWISLFQKGLLIRPSGVATVGAMFGLGIYFADKARKSIGYTSLSGSYWVRGNANKAYLALFSVNLGNKKIVNRHSSECYNFSEKNISPYNSVHATAGADLRNPEFIIYNGNRCTIKYLLEIK